MIYLVGGAPRVGKTTLVKYLVGERPMHAISTDAIRYMLRRSVPQHVLHQKLMASHEDHIESELPEHTLKHQNAESDALWPYLVQLMRSYDEDGFDLVVEGVAVLPSLANTLDVPHRTIIVGNTEQSHAALLRERASKNSSDWLHDYSVAQVGAYANFFLYMSSWLQAEAKRYGVPYIEIRDETFTEDLQTAARKLLD